MSFSQTQSVSHTRRFPLFILLLLSLLAAPIPGGSSVRAQSAPNGVHVEGANPDAAQGVVSVYGVADHPTFRKWQLDLLVGGNDAVFLALGEKPLPGSTLLAKLDTRLYPNGAHQLRLRVVHSNLNYDEYFLPLSIANGSEPASAFPSQALPAQAPTDQRAAATSSPAPAKIGAALAPGQNGLALVAQGARVAVRGVADHPAFRKWQVDLLLDGDEKRTVFLAVGEKRVNIESELATFAPGDYPPGAHQVRLRVVHTNLNYDEYIQPLSVGPVVAGSPAATGGRSGLVARASAAGNAVYLTFDDGPHPRNTPRILEILAEYNARATFFVVGSHAQGRGALLKEMYDAGHAIGNHSWGHRKLGNADWETFEDEVGATASVLGGYGSRCLRPPYGDVGPALTANAAEAGYTLVYWSVDSLDWKNQNPERIAEEVLRYVKPGSIILFHDGGGDRAGTAAALEIILEKLSAEGYTFPALCRG